ncbi:MAG: ABC transporter ATP-binding protein [Actinomycetota bacterium]|nr:ABC transporter ATP-binding protein [Actinomycetota bacterium]
MTTAHLTGRTSTILEIEGLSVSFSDKDRTVRAVDQVSLAVDEGDVLAVVGESGCGKSTLAHSILGVLPPAAGIDSGRILLRGRDLVAMSRKELNTVRGTEVAMVFQAAMTIFNPVITIGQQVDHILQAHPGVFGTAEAGKRHFQELLALVRLPVGRVMGAFESRLSGGMKQRVAIAVALLLKPGILVLDEPTTALDVLNQRLVIDILRDLNEALGVTIIFATHDLAVVAELASRVAVMYAGRLVELGDIDDIFSGDHRHPYVAGLIDAVPTVLGDKAFARPIPGQVPNLAALPSGCRFHPRCALAREQCREEDPPLETSGPRHAVACFAATDRWSETGIPGR